MSPRERSRQGGSPDILATLAAGGIEMTPVAANRHLIANELPDHEMAEFISPQYGMRILAVPEDSPDAVLRNQLAEHEVPVPQQIGSEGGVGLWLIPPGTQTIGAAAHRIAVDPAKYGSLLRRVGEAHRLAYESGLGAIAPIEGVRLIDRFAFAPDVHSAEGVGVFLIPPYDFAPTMPPDQFAHIIYDELAAIPGLFTPAQLQYLGQQMYAGGGGV